MKCVVDVAYSDERSVHLISPLTKRARDWFTENIPDSAQRSGDATVVEHRYIDMVVEAIVRAGLEVRKNGWRLVWNEDAEALVFEPPEEDKGANAE